MAEAVEQGTLALRERLEADSALEVATLRELWEIAHHPDEVDLSFSDGTVDLQSERIEGLKRRREELLRELAPLDAEAIADAMRDPAVYLQYALLGMMDRCRQRVVWAEPHYGLGGTQESAYFATLREPRPDRPVWRHHEPELMMRVGFVHDEEGTMEPRFFSVKTDFRRRAYEEVSRYEFYVRPSKDGSPILDITELYWRNAAWRRGKVEDPVEQHILLQKLVTDMEYELHAMVPENHELARQSTAYWVYNQTELA